jgi:secretion/DNA translocation related TadE-like protein
VVRVKWSSFRTSVRRRPVDASLLDGTERGAGTVLATGLVLLLCLMLVAVAAVIQAGMVSAQAGKAADLAALAGADAARGLLAGEPCSLAAEVADKQEAEMSVCRRSGPGGVVVDVRTRTRLPEVFGWINGQWTHAEGRARAGPPP